MNETHMQAIIDSRIYVIEDERRTHAGDHWSPYLYDWDANPGDLWPQDKFGESVGF